MMAISGPFLVKQKGSSSSAKRSTSVGILILQNNDPSLSVAKASIFGGRKLIMIKHAFGSYIATCFAAVSCSVLAQ